MFDVFDPQPADKDHKVKRDKVGQSGVLLARILKHYDALVELRDKGQLDRAHLMPLLYREFTGAPTVHIDGSSESTNMVVEVPPLST